MHARHMLQKRVIQLTKTLATTALYIYYVLTYQV